MLPFQESSQLSWFYIYTDLGWEYDGIWCNVFILSSRTNFATMLSYRTAHLVCGLKRTCPRLGCQSTDILVVYHRCVYEEMQIELEWIWLYLTCPVANLHKHLRLGSKAERRGTEATDDREVCHQRILNLRIHLWLFAFPTCWFSRCFLFFRSLIRMLEIACFDMSDMLYLFGLSSVTDYTSLYTMAGSNTVFYLIVPSASTFSSQSWARLPQRDKPFQLSRC